MPIPSACLGGPVASPASPLFVSPITCLTATGSISVITSAPKRPLVALISCARTPISSRSPMLAETAAAAQTSATNKCSRA